MRSTADLAADSIRIICGPTAAGKSGIALQLALEHGGTIVSADSRQIYRGFDIGTAKPSWDERRAVPHQGVDIADPSDRYSASRWATGAISWIEAARLRGGTPIVVGGTGFYIRALVEPLFDSPPLDPAARSALEKFLASLPTPELERWCAILDPARAHLGRVQLARAVETALLSGRRLSDLQSRALPAAPVRAHYLVVDPVATLASRIESRVDAMFDAGWLNEVRALSATVDANAPAWKASGYRVMRAAAAGALDLSTARERIIIETRQYAKRQRTWFRHQLAGGHVTRLNPDDPDRPAIMERWWKESA